jgi:hypothetical protein
MKKFSILILLLAIVMTGCSYEVSARNSQKLQGESENWKAEYQADFTTDYHQNDGKLLPEQKHRNRILVTYKKDLSSLSGVKHMEISYQDSFGSCGKLTEDFDSSPKAKQYRLSGGSADNESQGYPVTPENLHKYIMMYSGPCEDIKKNASAVVTIQTDDKLETIRLAPEKNPSPFTDLSEQLKTHFSKKAFFRFFSGYASDFSLKLEKSDIRIVADKAKSGSSYVTSGERAGQELVPTVLYYEFTVRNDGRKQISGSMNDLQVKIVPGGHLKEVSREVAGVDIFDPNSGYGSGQSIDDIFNIHKDSKIELSFDISREGPQGTLITPSEEKLKELLSSAEDAKLVIIYKNETAASFDLNNDKEVK